MLLLIFTIIEKFAVSEVMSCISGGLSVFLGFLMGFSVKSSGVGDH